MYVLTVTETLEDWEDSVNIGRFAHNMTHNRYIWDAVSAIIWYFFILKPVFFVLFGVCS